MTPKEIESRIASLESDSREHARQLKELRELQSKVAALFATQKTEANEEITKPHAALKDEHSQFQPPQTEPLTEEEPSGEPGPWQ